MSKTAKICLAIGASVVFILVSISILVRVVVTPDKFKEHLLPLAEEALQRKIDLGQIEIGFFSGVSLVDLRVQKRLSAEDFLSVKSLVLKYKLLPLLTGDLIIDQILLEEPRIEIVRAADGSFNFSDLLAVEKEQGMKPNQEQAGSQGAGGSSVFDLLVKQVTISGGELMFIDRSQNSRSPYRYSFDRLNIKATQITLEEAFPIEMNAELNGSRVALSGHVDIAGKRGDLDLQLEALDLVKFSPYYRQSLPGKLGSAALTLNVEAQFDTSVVDSKGKLLLENLDLVLNDYPEAALQKAALGIDYALNFDLKNQLLDVSTLLINFNEAIVGAEGRVDLAGKDPQLDLSLLFNQLNLRTLFEALPSGLTKDFQIYSLAGVLDGQVSLQGKPQAGAGLLQTAEIEFTDVNATVAEMRAGVTGKVSYSGEQAKAQQLQVSVAEQQLLVDITATDVLSELIRGDFQVTAKQLDLNRLIPAGETDGEGGSGQPVIERPATFAEEIGPFELPIDMTGRLRVDKLIYKQLDLERVEADLTLKDNHLKISQLRGDIAGGEFSATSDVNLGVKGFQYQGQMRLDQSNLLGVVSGLLPEAEQSVSGLMQWQNNFSGRGTIPDNLLRSLQVKGLLQLQQGEISGSPLLEQLAVFLGLPDLKVLSFEALESRYDLRNGLASLSGQLNSSKAKLTQTGTVGVDGALDLKLDARIAPELMQRMGVKAGLTNAVSDKDGWGILPLAIKGSLTSPKVAFDAEALQQQAAQKVKEEASQRLLEKVAPGGGAEQEPVKQLLEGTLQKLFGN